MTETTIDAKALLEQIMAAGRSRRLGHFGLQSV